MIVNTSHPEEDSYSAIQNLAEEKGAKMLHFMRGKHIYAEYWDIVLLQMVVNGIGKIFSDTANIRAFFMHDVDIILLFHNISEDNIFKVESLIKDVFNCENNQLKESNIYNIVEDYSEIEKICNKKQSIWQVWQQKNKTTKPNNNKIKIDEEYAKELLEKRNKRKGMHILLVEDEPFTLKLIEGILAEHTIIKATNGSDAVESYMLNAPDLVFLDINLPDIDGHKVLEHINKFDPNSYVIMLSGNTLMKDVSYALNKGAKGFIVKPFPKEKLLNHVVLCKSIKDENNFLNEAV